MESQGIFYDAVKFVFNAVIKVITLVISAIIEHFWLILLEELLIYWESLTTSSKALSQYSSQF
jgi:hypothetical protein